MKSHLTSSLRLSLLAALLCLGLVVVLMVRSTRSPAPVQAQETAPAPDPAAAQAAPDAPPDDPPAAEPIPAQTPDAEPTAPAPNLESAPPASGATLPPGGPATAPAEAPDDPDHIQLSFQGANIDMVLQWLAKTSGKSVVKHPRVQCQLTIISSERLPRREAIDLVYRALSLEGFTTVESATSILIVPDGQEPKVSPELIESTRTELPEGRQRLVRIFQVEHLPASELRERIKGVLSDRAVVEVDDRGNRIIITDFTDNIRLLGDLIARLDVISPSDTVIDIYPLKHSQAEELAGLLNLVLNQQAGIPPSSRPAQPSPAGMPPGMPPGMSPPMPSSGPQPSSSPSPGAPGQQVHLWPDRTANRLIVSAPQSRLEEIRMLVEVLDTEKPADVAIRVIPLKNASAEDLARAVAPLYQRMSGRSLKDMIEVTANTRSNSLIVLSNETNFDGILALVATLDTEEAQERVLQAFPLRNADAEDVAKQLQDLHRDQQSSTRFIYYYPMPQSQVGKFGFVADRRRNTVIVQAPPGSMESIGEMIRALDEPVTDQALAPKIYQLKYVSAVDIEDVLNELFLKRQQTRSYWDYYSGAEETSRDIGRLYGKVRITSEPYSNSIIVTANSLESLQAVEDVLGQLDVPSQAGESTLRISLKFASAVQVASSLNVLFARGGAPPLRQTPQPGQPPPQSGQPQPGAPATRGFELERDIQEDAYFPWLGSAQETYRTSENRAGIRPVSDLVGRVRVVPDRRTNSLLLTSNVHFFPQLLKLIDDLDAPTTQIVIEAKIIEVASDFRDRLGVRWSPDGRASFEAEDLDNSLMPSARASFQEVFAGSPLPGALRTGVLDATVNLDVLIQFLRRNTESTVLAEPQINVSDNEMGQLFVGAQVPFITQSLITTEGGRNDSFAYRDVGIILEVTPNINNSDEVAMKIRAESSNIRSGQTLFGGAILDTRYFKTDVLVRSGETVVLGGILQREEVDTVRKVPVLGSIPVLGWAFKKKDKGVREVELMVFLRPVITRTAEDAKRLAEEIEHRTPRLQPWRNHGLLQPPAPE